MTQQKLKTGQFLLANPTLNGSVFENAIVFLLDYTPEHGAYGTIINTNSHIPLNEVFSGLPENDWKTHPFFLGGPVEDTQIQMLQLDPNLSISPKEIVPGLYIGGKIEDNIQAVEQVIFSEKTRLILGYSGWGPGQLENEVIEGAWDIYSTDPISVFECQIDDLSLTPQEFCDRFEEVSA